MKFKRIYLEITNLCNLKCSFCSPLHRQKRKMNKKEFEHIISEIKNYTDLVYFHIKGEPFLNNYILDFLKICEDNKILVKITTNGTLLSKYYLELMKYKNLKQINISLHSEHHNNNYYDEIFKIGDHLSSRMTIVYRIWSLKDLRFNNNSLEIIDKLQRYYHLEDRIIDQIKKEKNIKIKDNIYLDKDDLFKWPNLEEEVISLSGTCYGTRTHLGILVDGTVVPCCLDGNGIVKLGNIHETSFRDIISSKRFQKINSGMKTNSLVEELCQKCQYKIRFEKNLK